MAKKVAPRKDDGGMSTVMLEVDRPGPDGWDVEKITFYGRELAEGEGNIYPAGYPKAFVVLSLYSRAGGGHRGAYVGHASASVGSTGLYRQEYTADTLKGVLLGLARFDPAKAFRAASPVAQGIDEGNLFESLAATQRMGYAVFLARQAQQFAFFDLAEKYHGALYSQVPLSQRHKHLGPPILGSEQAIVGW